jgi:hypothetical protein
MIGQRRFLALALLVWSAVAWVVPDTARAAYYRTAVFPWDLVESARGYWAEVGIGIRDALEDFPELNVAYVYDENLADYMGVRRLRLREGEAEALWVKPSPYLIGAPNYPLVYEIAQRSGVDLVLMYAMDLDMENREMANYTIEQQTVFVIDTLNQRAYQYQEKDNDGWMSEVSTGVSWRSVSSALRQFLDEAERQRGR